MRHTAILFGPLSAGVLATGIICLPAMVPDYDPIRQTVSEIGEVGSPAQMPFTTLLIAVAVCLLVFAWALHDLSRRRGLSPSAAYAVGFMAIPVAGVGVFAFPHPLHNVFGLAELIGYQAPLVLALTWRRETEARRAVSFSWIMTAVVWIAIALNLATLARESALWSVEAPVYGLVQRSLFAAWFIWVAGLGVILAREATLRLRLRLRL